MTKSTKAQGPWTILPRSRICQSDRQRGVSYVCSHTVVRTYVDRLRGEAPEHPVTLGHQPMKPKSPSTQAYLCTLSLLHI